MVKSVPLSPYTIIVLLYYKSAASSFTMLYNMVKEETEE